MSGRSEPPRLLVSVRSAEEARSALAGGADIIDVKEPNHGSLGRALPDVIHSVASLPNVGTPSTPFSVALGEVHEAPKATSVPLPYNITFVKLGLAYLRADTDWRTRWLQARQSFIRNSRSPVGWIAVIYADADAAQAPPADEVIEAAAGTGCVGLLVDTYGKSGGRLFDHMSSDELALWAQDAHSQGLIFAAAGSLSVDDLPGLASVAVDVIAVRSAVCHRHDRRAALCADAVARFKRAVQAMIVDPRPPSATCEAAAHPPAG